MSKYTIRQTTIDEPLDIQDLTTQALPGNGVLDVLLDTMRLHLDREFKAQRIVGKEYSNTYLAAYESTLEQSIIFLMAKEKQALELELLQAQVDLAQAQTKKTEAETLLLPEQLKILENQLKISEKELELKGKELDIADANKELIKQKVVTEKAQTEGTVIKPGSVLGKQNDVLDAQVEGYKRDAEQKLLRILVDTWIVRRNTDEAEEANLVNKLDNDFIGKAVTAGFKGIGINT